MEDSYRNNIIDFSMIYLGKKLDINDEALEFTTFIFKQLFNIDINITGYGLDNSTKQMTNDMGDLKIYNENDQHKLSYLCDIKKGDLVFFHNQSLESTSPTPANKYPGHIGIYIGDNEFIHVSDDFNEIVIDKISDKWLNTLVASRDIIKYILKKDLNKKNMLN